jgi:hypothetical protein
MTHGALRLSIALGAAVVALLKPVAPATAESRPHGSHGFAGSAVHGHGFRPSGPPFHHGFAGGGVHRPAMSVVHAGGHRYALSGGRAYTHAHHYGYAYGHRYAYGRHGYAYRHYGGGYYAGGYSYPYYAGGYYHHHHRYYAGGYYYGHHHAAGGTATTIGTRCPRGATVRRTGILHPSTDIPTSHPIAMRMASTEDRGGAIGATRGPDCTGDAAIRRPPSAQPTLTAVRAVSLSLMAEHTSAGICTGISCTERPPARLGDPVR